MTRFRALPRIRAVPGNPAAGVPEFTIGDSTRSVALNPRWRSLWSTRPAIDGASRMSVRTHPLRSAALAPTLALVVAFSHATALLHAADAPAPKLALSFKPMQKYVDVENPTGAEIDKCKVEVERTKTTSGWVVYGPQGQMLRRFVDTDADNIVDQWRYYLHGLEVYRDIDTNADNKVDQSRWLNTGGTRWGIDSNQDGKIDRWKIISAHEVSFEVVRAMTTGDDSILQAVLLTDDDAETIGLTSAASREIRSAVADASRKFRANLGKSKTIGRDSTWLRFDASSPSIVPEDAGKADRDLWVYENAMAIVETGGQSGLVSLGEMVRVGDVWKLTQVPQPLEGESLQIAAGGALMVPSVGGGEAGPTAVPNLSENVLKLLQKLRELDDAAPAITADRERLVEYNKRRAALLEQLVTASETPDEREQFWRQMVDGLSAAVQTGAYPDGLEKLQGLETQLVRAQPKSPLVPYITYRRLLAEYSTRMQAAGTAQRGEVQEWWLEQLEAFGKAYPAADDSADALFQLANAFEFSGEIDDAKKWYGVVAKEHGKTATGQRAAGAIRRIDSVGQPFALRGTDLTGNSLDVARLKGKVVLVVFWATWSQPFEQEVPQLQALEREYGPEGFTIVGVNVDVVRDQVRPFIEKTGLRWPHIFEEGGLESAPAKQYGVIALPTMFLLDRTGKVVSRSAALEEIKEAVPKLVEGN